MYSALLVFFLHLLIKKRKKKAKPTHHGIAMVPVSLRTASKLSKYRAKGHTGKLFDWGEPELHVSSHQLAAHALQQQKNFHVSPIITYGLQSNSSGHPLFSLYILLILEGIFYFTATSNIFCSFFYPCLRFHIDCDKSSSNAHTSRRKLLKIAE